MKKYIQKKIILPAVVCGTMVLLLTGCGKNKQDVNLSGASNVISIEDVTPKYTELPPTAVPTNLPAAGEADGPWVEDSVTEDGEAIFPSEDTATDAKEETPATSPEEVTETAEPVATANPMDFTNSDGPSSAGESEAVPGPGPGDESSSAGPSADSSTNNTDSGSYYGPGMEGDDPGETAGGPGPADDPDLKQEEGGPSSPDEDPDLANASDDSQAPTEVSEPSLYFGPGDSGDIQLYGLSQDTTYAVSVNVSGEIILYVDTDGKVTLAEGKDASAKSIASVAGVSGKSYGDAMAAIVGAAKNAGYFGNDASNSIEVSVFNVSGSDETAKTYAKDTETVVKSAINGTDLSIKLGVVCYSSSGDESSLDTVFVEG